jgi:hypothetical protein
MLMGQIMVSFADRGAGKRKAKVSFNIKTGGSFASNLNFNLKTGLRYTGSFSLKNSLPAAASNIKLMPFNSFMTYQKGSSVYIVPYKQKAIVSEVQRGVNGPKLVIRLK